jgi:hypothetical protein
MMIIDGGEPWEGAVYMEGPGWVDPEVYDAAAAAFTAREYERAAEDRRWDETPDGDQDGTIEFDADLAFELQGDR